VDWSIALIKKEKLDKKTPGEEHPDLVHYFGVDGA
jgi:hypothetical protein